MFSCLRRDLGGSNLIIPTPEPPKCPNNQICLKCGCRPGFRMNVKTGKCERIDPCENVKCQFRAHCEEGKCKCNKGFIPRGNECIPEDPCFEVKCGANEMCSYGRCICKKGYVLRNKKCVPDNSCEEMTCPAQNEVCEFGKCVCKKGTFRRDGKCREVVVCKGVECGENEICKCGCDCDDGWVHKDGKCQLIDPCANVKCGANAECKKGACVCKNGYVLRTTKCVPDKSCEDLKCKENETCQCGKCICKPGFVFTNGKCTPVDPCAGAKCPANSACKNGVCVCDKGYSPGKLGACLPDDKCKGVMCRDLQNCKDGICVCKDPNAPKNWTCLVAGPGQVVPVMQNSQCDIQCMSKDGKNCLWTDSLAKCEQTKGETCGCYIKPLVCGAPHKAVHGITGYDNPNHWCNKGRDPKPPVPPNPCDNVKCKENEACKDGKCYCRSTYTLRNGKCVPDKSCEGLNCGDVKKCVEGKCVCKGSGSKTFECLLNGDGGVTPVRMNENCDTECLSTDGINCQWRRSKAECEEVRKTPSSQIKPLVCGPTHVKYYGITGYNNPAHWCTRGQDPKPVDACYGKQCQANSTCKNGSCVCNNGFSMRDGKCIDAQSCVGVKCSGANEECQKGKCLCKSGFSMCPKSGKCIPTPPPPRQCPKPTGSYALTCKDDKVIGDCVLNSQCRRINGTWKNTSLHMPNCKCKDGQPCKMKNIDGHLQCE